ncbi:glutathione S-transferase family protein [Primorskyibacter sp. S187A]|uniref:glutathione S-transferase family protein n=1 Tax=Primorskyibacter sp. S187A TaxID=3415130 RepID=UPI003C7D565C
MYKVLGGVASRAFRVLWVLEELGADYEFVPAKPRSEAVRAVNPSGKIPVLLDGAHVLTDSSAIMTYLTDKHGVLTFDAGSIERAHQDALLHTILDELDAVLWTAARHSFVLPEDQRVPQIKTSLKAEFVRNLERLVDRVNGPYLMGDMMTVPDILLTHCCNWAVSAKFPAPPDALSPYLSAMRARPAFKRVRALAEMENVT